MKVERGTFSVQSKYGVISGPYYPLFGLNTGKYGPEITLYLDTFHAVSYPKLCKDPSVKRFTKFTEKRPQRILSLVKLQAHTRDFTQKRDFSR